MRTKLRVPHSVLLYYVLYVYSAYVTLYVYMHMYLVCRMGVILKTAPIPSVSVPTLLLVKLIPLSQRDYII